MSAFRRGKQWRTDRGGAQDHAAHGAAGAVQHYDARSICLCTLNISVTNQRCTYVFELTFVLLYCGGFGYSLGLPIGLPLEADHDRGV